MSSANGSAFLVDARIWDDERFYKLSDIAQNVYFYLTTSRVRGRLPGLVVTGPASIAEALRRTVDVVRDALRALVRATLVEWDEESRVIRIEQCTASCPNQYIMIRWFADFESIPDCALKWKHLATLRLIVNPTTPKMLQAWSETFEQAELEHKRKRKLEEEEEKQRAAKRAEMDMLAAQLASDDMPTVRRPSVDDCQLALPIQEARALPMPSLSDVVPKEADLPARVPAQVIHLRPKT